MKQIKNALGQSPAWLTIDELEQAQTLIDLGFHYCADSTEFITFEDYEVKPDASVGKWKICSSCEELGIDVICRKALFFKGFDDISREDLDKEIKKAKSAIRKVINHQNSRVKQLSLLTLLEV
jgi:hypothetical protein